MDKKYKPLIGIGCGLVFAIGCTCLINTQPLLSAIRANETKTIRYHLADDASLGEKSSYDYTVTDPSSNYYYAGFVSAGTFSSSGLTLASGEYFQADLKGATSVSINCTGTFAVELSSDNQFAQGHHTYRKYLSSGGTYNFGTKFQYVRVLSCANDSVLTDINLYCECSEDYTFITTAEMDESYWTDTVEENKITLISGKKNNIYDVNYHEVRATKTAEGVHFFVKERVGGGYYKSTKTDYINKWWGSDNIEIQINNVDSTQGRTQLYASTEDSNCGNFNVVVESKTDHTGYEYFHVINYKCFISWDTLSQYAGKTYSSTDDLYIWYSSRADDNNWQEASEVKLTANGLVDKTSAAKRSTYYSREGEWAKTNNWVTINSDLASAGRATVAMNCKGAIGASPSSAWGVYNWRGPLAILPLTSNYGKRTVFRLDWWGWDDGIETGVFVPTSRNNGAEWAPESARTTDNSTTQFYQTVKDCEMVWVYEYDSTSHVYTVARIMFPNDTSILHRKDYYFTQTVTCEQSLAACLNAEFTNFTIYQA